MEETNLKWTTWKYIDGVTISAIHNSILDGEWIHGELNEVIIEIPYKFYTNKYEDLDDR